jgi:hypothetical protein
MPAGERLNEVMDLIGAGFPVPHPKQGAMVGKFDGDNPSTSRYFHYSRLMHPTAIDDV